jgi:hypothetical protein
MDDMNAFERLVAEETRAEAGPSRPTDVAAVMQTVAAKSPQWRFHRMSGAFKMLAAAATMAIVGALLVGGPFLPGAQDRAVTSITTPSGEPVTFEGRWSYGGGGSEISEPEESGWLAERDGRWWPAIIEAGDPRLDGTLSLVANGNSYLGLEIWNGYFRIENEHGAWQQRPMIQSVKRDVSSEPMTWTAVFDGEGDYADLVAIMGITRRGGGWDVEGVILDAVLPPTPELPNAYD